VLGGVIFDMDGVIVDSHGIHIKAWREFLRAKGCLVTDSDLDFVRDGRKKEDILRHFLGDFFGGLSAATTPQAGGSLYRYHSGYPAIIGRIQPRRHSHSNRIIRQRRTSAIHSGASATWKVFCDGRERGRSRDGQARSCDFPQSGPGSADPTDGLSCGRGFCFRGASGESRGHEMFGHCQRPARRCTLAGWRKRGTSEFHEHFPSQGAGPLSLTLTSTL